MMDRDQGDPAKHDDHMRLGRRIAALVVALTVAAFVPAPVAALDVTDLATAYGIEPAEGDYYLYIPDALMVRTSADADQWISEMEIALDIDPSVGTGMADAEVYADRPDLNRVDKAARIVAKHWASLYADCDAAGVFALMYLETSYTVRDHIAMQFFDDNEQLSVVTVAFIALYFDAWKSWQEGDIDDVPLPWQEAFAAGEARATSVLEDMFLGMNGHINYDLAIAMYETGVVIDGESRKPDHDRINAVLQAAAPRVGHKMADHYDASQRPHEDSDTYYEETWLTFAPINAWREGAWEHAVALDQAVTESQRDLIRQNMEAHGFTVAQGFQTPKDPGAWDVREAYCFANQ